ncbi:hypothetical protein FYK55_07285 [Roseiconus nitratireducens]|uniref:SPOR domain-containing protein n=1 Tax=Roseiconus nitratireducens TaxID=2605748 RepID=A0A5M6DJH7_9BACT|nr:hypothetical protein [Roseiconus nitratireducens]KAA5545445.1 hypothetical protein FYK55_07285 [Roseiconus nitratireducens]
MNASQISAGVLTVLLTITSWQPAGAADASATPVSPSWIDPADLYYDYDVFAGEPEFRWQIIWNLRGGGSQISGNFTSYIDAEDFAEGLLEYHLEPAGTIGYEIVEVEVSPNLQFVLRYDKRVDAEALAAALEGIGMYTDVRPVRVLMLGSR